MAETERADLDKVFKALGSETRRRILRILSQRPSYPYELSKLLGLTPKGVAKHLEALQEAGLVQREAGESDLGPDRVYYRLNTRFGLSTTILPDAFVVRITQREATGRTLVPRGFFVPEARPDEAAVRELLRELGKVNRRLSQLEDERMRFTSLRSKIIRKIEEIMEHCSWDDESCQRVRALIDPARPRKSDTRPFSEIWSETVKQTLKMFETLFEEFQSESIEEEDLAIEED
ncbi:ArsR family transcriptional regulator [Candidatus Thorarchaeota archaeon]|jgi:predicted transcriptional regulator|nr:MAG: ArsR family transcriptional regulator [Candidatus Thorarchaeota archaeon]